MSTNEHENFASAPSTSVRAQAPIPAAPLPTEPAVTLTEPVEGGGAPLRPLSADRLRPRTGTIVWGVLVLAFCLYTGFQAVAPGSIDGTTFAIAAIIGLGLLLLAVGAAVVVRSTRQQKR